ncbi:hypothetical protein D3C83_87600 [compost metagenome]
MNGASNRCESTTWKISPATMYSFARATMVWYSAGAVLDCAGTTSGPALATAVLSSGRSRLSTMADSRSVARA